MANSVDPDQMPHFAASDLNLHCLLRSVCPKTWCYYSKYKRDSTLHLVMHYNNKRCFLAVFVYLFLDIGAAAILKKRCLGLKCDLIS